MKMNNKHQIETYCALCLNEVPLCKSHIVSNHLYKDMFDSNHRLLLVEDDWRTRFLQSGIYEKLLCAECDSGINLFAEIPFWPVWEKIPTTMHADHHIVAKEDAEHVRRFVLSILWRASVARGDTWKHVDLGRKHNELIREALLNRDDSILNKYQMWATLLVDENNSVQKGLITTMVLSRQNGHAVWYWVAGGIEWVVMVTSHRYQGNLPNDVWVKKEEEALLMVRSWKDSISIKHHIRCNGPYPG